VVARIVNTWSHVLTEGTKSPSIAFSPSTVAFASKLLNFGNWNRLNAPSGELGVSAATFALGFGMNGTLLQPNAGRF
jgi:hypothetical protein